MTLTKPQYTLAATALGSSLAFIDASAVIVAMPTMQKALNLGLEGEQWIFLSYSLALAALYLVAGIFGDRWGRRKVFVYGTIGFALASVLAGLAPNGALLILSRVLQGISGAFVTTNSLAWLRSVYADQAGKAVGLWTSLTSISTIIAPPLGGALTEWLSWRYIFYINLPLAALVLYWASRASPDKEQASRDKPLDLAGSVLIAAAFGFLTYFLVAGARSGFSELWWSLAAGLAGVIAFVAVEAKLPNPLLPLRLFKIRDFTFANLETFLIYGALYGIFVYFTLYLQFLGLSPLTSSLFLIPTSLVLIILAPFFGKRADRLGPRNLLTSGPLLIGIGALIFSLIKERGDVWLQGSLGLAIFSFGLAMLVAPITSTALKAVPTHLSGLASGFNNTVARLGSLVVIALIGMIISIIFFSRVDDKKAVPLGLHQNTPSHKEASVQGYQVGMWLVAGLAFSSAAVGWFGISNRPAEQTKS
jgi:EmrB/QacA subfamily drug resistance transporter